MRRFAPLFALLILCWVSWAAGEVLDRNLPGIIPRTREGLWGLLFAPFAHAGVDHLLSNSGPLLILGIAVASRGAGTFYGVTASVMGVGGGLVWLFGRSAEHVGASGLVFGYFGWVLGRAWFERSFGSIALALVIGALYTSLIWGVLPTDSGISWEGHLFGALAGLLSARVAKPNRLPMDEEAIER